MKNSRPIGMRLKKGWSMAFFCLCLFFFPCRIFPQTKASNKVLQDIVAQLPDLQLDKGVSGEFNVPSISPRTIVIERNSQGVIEHVGVNLFSRELIAKHPIPIYRFVERYLLELLLLPTHDEVTVKLRMERVRLSSEVYRTSDYRKMIRQILASFPTDCSVYITCNSNHWSVSCIDNNRSLLKIVLPVRYELITGFSKLEAENSVYLSMLEHRVEEPVPLTLNDVSVYKDSLYSYDEDYYAMEEIVSTSYYRAEADELIPLFSEEELPMSVYNLFNARHDWGVNVEITQSLYGGRKQTYSMPLFRVTQFLRKQNCVLYTGIKKLGGSAIEGLVLAVNAELGYQHLLSYKVEREVFRHPQDTEMTVRMYSYIPIHNVSTLFDDKKR